MPFRRKPWAAPLLVLAGLASAAATALPMGSRGDTMLMLESSPDEREFAGNYAISGTHAPGALLGRWTEHHAVRDYAAASWTHRIHRWNLPHAQANLWAVGLLGQARGDGQRQALAGGALMADYETTRVYAGAGLHAMRAGDWRHDRAWLRTGFSFYEAAYDAVQPWFIVELKRQRQQFDTKTVVTPMLRLIHKRVFVELGANRDGGQFNVMYVL